MLRAVAILGLTVVVAGVIVAQEQPELTARELFYGVNSSKKTPPAAGRKTAQTIKKPATPHPSATESKSDTATTSHTGTTKPDSKYAALGLRYSVLKRSASGQFAETDASATFQSGDGIRVTIEANDDAYLYIV